MRAFALILGLAAVAADPIVAPVPGFPEQETATHAIVGRVLWACGLNVTEDHVVFFAPGDLVIAPDAVVKDVFGHKRPMHRADLDAILAQLAVASPGQHRGLASMWLDGKPPGGPPAEGVRADDANDRIPHELRRDLRGSYALFASLDHVDVQESNFLDMWVAEGRRHYVKHYALDFGKALGVMNTTGANRRHGREYVIDVSAMLRSFATLGLTRRSWEGRVPSALPGIGMLEVDGFDPGAWKPDSPAYVATVRPGFTGETYVHIARDPASDAVRVIGLWRS